MLTGKQRSYLKSLSNSMQPVVHVGKSGINDNLVKQADDALECRELIKGTVLRNSPAGVREAAEELAQRTQADIVSVVGSKFVLYRESVNNKNIELK